MRRLIPIHIYHWHSFLSYVYIHVRKVNIQQHNITDQQMTIYRGETTGSHLGRLWGCSLRRVPMGDWGLYPQKFFLTFKYVLSDNWVYSGRGIQKISHLCKFNGWSFRQVGVFNPPPQYPIASSLTNYTDCSTRGQYEYKKFCQDRSCNNYWKSIIQKYGLISRITDQ